MNQSFGYPREYWNLLFVNVFQLAAKSGVGDVSETGDGVGMGAGFLRTGRYWEEMKIPAVAARSVATRRRIGEKPEGIFGSRGFALT